jgi:hypothetical protein
MAMLDLTNPNLWPNTESSATENIKHFVNKSDLLKSAIHKYSMSFFPISSFKANISLNIETKPIWDSQDGTNAEINIMFNYLTQNIQNEDSEGFLFDDKFHGTPISIKTLDADFIYVGKGHPRFNIDID